MSAACVDVMAERTRQIEVEGWDVEHDDKHRIGQLAVAGACYALNATYLPDTANRFWPWDQSWWKPKDTRRDLVRAAALIIAEIERLDRMSGT